MKFEYSYDQSENLLSRFVTFATEQRRYDFAFFTPAFRWKKYRHVAAKHARRLAVLRRGRPRSQLGSFVGCACRRRRGRFQFPCESALFLVQTRRANNLFRLRTSCLSLPERKPDRPLSSDCGSADVHPQGRAGVDRQTLAASQTEWDRHIWGEDASESSPYLHRLALHPATMRKGLGANLLTWITQLAANGQKNLRLDCVADNPRLNQFYQRNGFQLLGTTDGHHKWQKSVEPRA